MNNNKLNQYINQYAVFESGNMFYSPLKIIIFFAVNFLFLKCATQSPPTGGPVDRISPRIILTEPGSNTVNLAKLDKIRIQFSERMEEGSLKKALFISPLLNNSLKWKKGRQLDIIIDDTLRNNQTYVVSIGAEVTDMRRNKMAGSYHFAFSTGAYIDQGTISGRVYGLKRTETATMFAYLVENAEVDISRQPDYISQSGKGGEFTFSYLKPGHFRILAVVDQNNNLTIDSDYERIGIPYRDVYLDSSQLSFSSLEMKMTKNDTIPPQVLGIRPIHDKYLQLRLSESVLYPERSMLMLMDSLNTDEKNILAISPNIESASTMDIYTEELDTSTYLLTVPDLADSAGNRLGGKTNLSFTGIEYPDTTKFKIITSLPADSIKNHAPDAPILLEFSHPVNWDSIGKVFELLNEAGMTVAGNWKILSAFDAEFFTNTPLPPDSSFIYRLKLNKALDIWGNTLKDSVFNRYFTIIPERELGEIAGRVTVQDSSSGKIILNFRNILKRGFESRLSLLTAGDYRKLYLSEGQYLINGYLDKDNNGHYSHGTLFPFTFAEPFVFLQDTIKVRKRWETEGKNLVIPSWETPK